MRQLDLRRPARPGVSPPSPGTGPGARDGDGDRRHLRGRPLRRGEPALRAGLEHHRHQAAAAAPAARPASVGVVSEPLLDEQGELGRSASALQQRQRRQRPDPERRGRLLRGARLRLDRQRPGAGRRRGRAGDQLLPALQHRARRGLKGPGGFLYGGNPIAATINMVRRQPEPAKLPDASAWRAAASAPRRRPRLERRRRGSARLSASTASGASPTATARARRASCGRSTRASPGAPTERSSLHVNAELLDTSFSPDCRAAPGRGISPDAPYRGRPARPRLRVAVRPLRPGDPASPGGLPERALGPADAAQQGLLPQPGLGFDRHDLQRRLPQRRGPAGRSRARSSSWTTGRSSSATSSKPCSRPRPAAVEHQLLAGLEIAWLSDRFTLDFGFLPGIDLLAPVETAQGPVFLIPGQSQAADAASVVIAPYVVDQIRSPSASRCWSARASTSSTTRTTLNSHRARLLAALAHARPGLLAATLAVALRQRRPGLRAAVEPGGGRARGRGERADRGRHQGRALGRQGADHARRLRAGAGEHGNPRPAPASPGRPGPALAGRRAGAGGRAAAAACGRSSPTPTPTRS